VNVLVRELKPGDLIKVFVDDVESPSQAITMVGLVVGRSPGSPHRWPGKLVLVTDGSLRSFFDDWFVHLLTDWD